MLARALLQAPRQAGVLLQGAQGRPQAPLKGVVLLGEQALRRVGVPRAAAEVEGPLATLLEQRAAAFGAGQVRRLGAAACGSLRNSHGVGLLFYLVAERSSSRPGLVEEAVEQGADAGGRQDVVDFDVGDGARGHAGVVGVPRILYDGHAAALLDRRQAHSAVVQVAGEHHARHAWTVGAGRRAEQHVDRRTVAVLAGVAREVDVTVVDGEVAVGRGDVDPARPDGLPVRGMGGRQAARAGKDGGQRTVAFRRDVQDDEDGGWQVVRQAFDHRAEGLDPAGGSSDDDDVAAWDLWVGVQWALPSISGEDLHGACRVASAPEDPSSLSLLPSPSPRPGEGDPVEAIVLVGCAVRTFNDGTVRTAHPTSSTGSVTFPSPGRGEGDGRRDRDEGRAADAAPHPRPHVQHLAHLAPATGRGEGLLQEVPLRR